ncbi:conjugal transfer protein TraG N-terminal domain-containing protein [Methylomonas sp. SURF-1]|uniref:Conjugal transfer protein TraG N-terminal domain-containing protein n=2 Tax=Methylomonas TaxID=416 RepID=A0ABU4UBY5_9GAMM|nr:MULTISPECIES: conjugal transfer protein TraG N-terminal domain-containing protein [Methylomonas]MCQ8183506.1 conjugal transfer protein TraG N-terminal domain-containing protein [Methylomonas sp. SURF-1]MDX8126967.1 conjugal transfer protein TraG N-terminal domain-containing protein [Methylomonas sp. OY6]TPQ27624.1 conjugal transfer protein TraG [Methylomonas koyamae]
MIYEIFSIGDSQFLAAILNAIAMISLTDDYKGAAAVGASLGVTMVMLRGLTQFNASGIRYQDVFASMLIYTALFAPGVVVKVEDAYSGNVVVVNNVPFGPAVAGSILSNMGYRLTRLFEQGFSVPSMTEHGFADPLNTLIAVRKSLLSRITLGKANSPSAKVDLEASFVNYVKECTLTGVDLNQTTLDAIMRTASVMTAIRFNSKIYTTEVYLGAGPTVLTCTDAYAALDDYITKYGITGLEDLLQQTLNLARSEDVSTRISDALTALSNSTISANDYMLASLIVPMFEKGIVGRYEDGLKWNKAAMVHQSIQQRNMQWAAEQTLFTRIVRPMMTWIEGLSYAITPLMVFAVMLGSAGISMVGQYFKMLLWIQLWMPIMAVINLYITMSALGKMDALDAQGFNIPSIEGIYQMDMVLQDWVAIGGMLASSTPAIALMLVYGGSVTATHFMGRMQSGDYIDERAGSPAVLATAPVFANQSAYQHSPLKGTHRTGAENVLPTFNVSREASEAVSSSSNYMRQAGAQFMSSLANSAGNSFASNRDASTGQSFSRRLNSSSSETDKLMRSEGSGYAQRYSDTDMTSDQFASVLSGAMALGGSGLERKGGDEAEGNSKGGSKKDMLQANISDRLQSQFGLNSQRSNEIANDMATRLTEDAGFQTDLARSVASDAQSGTREVVSLGLNNQTLQSLQSSANDVLSASEAYSATASMQSRLGTNAQFGALESGQAISTKPGLMSRLNNELTRFGLSGDAQTLASDWRSSGLITDKNQAYAAAGMSLLTGHSPARFRSMNPSESQQAKTAGFELLRDSFAAKTGEIADPNKNAGLRADAPKHGQARAEFDRASVVDPRAAAGNLPHQVNARMSEIGRAVGAGEAKVSEFHDTEKNELTAGTRSEFAEMAGTKADYFAKEINHLARGEKSAGEMNYDGVAGALYSTRLQLESLGNEAYGIAGPFYDAMSKHLAEGDGYADAAQKAFSEAGEGGKKAVEAWRNTKGNEVANQLTPAQLEYYKAALTETGMGIRPADFGFGDGAGTAIAREKLVTEHGEGIGGDIAELLNRAATQNRPDLVRSIGNYNNAIKKNSEAGSVDSPTDYHPKADYAVPSHLKPIFDRVERQYGLPSGLLARMGEVESTFDPHVESEKGAKGIMQLMPETADRFGVTNREDPEQAIDGAGQYMRFLIDRYHGNLQLAVAAYNAGEGNVDKYQGIPPFKETQTYVRKVIGLS